MNIRDIRYTILLNAEPKDVLQLCRTDQLSNNICMNNEFQNEYMKNNNIKTNIKDFEQFKLVLFTLIEPKDVLQLCNNDQVFYNICSNNEFQNEYMKKNNLKTNIEDVEQFKLVLLTLIKTEEAIEMIESLGKYKVSFYNRDMKITFVIYKKLDKYYRSIKKELGGRNSYEIDEIHENINKFVFSLIYASLK